jgi:hypothetical protein
MMVARSHKEANQSRRFAAVAFFFADRTLCSVSASGSQTGQALPKIVREVTQSSSASRFTTVAPKRN